MPSAVLVPSIEYESPKQTQHEYTVISVIVTCILFYIRKGHINICSIKYCSYMSNTYFHSYETSHIFNYYLSLSVYNYYYTLKVIYYTCTLTLVCCLCVFITLSTASQCSSAPTLQQ